MEINKDFRIYTTVPCIVWWLCDKIEEFKIKIKNKK